MNVIILILKKMFNKVGKMLNIVVGLLHFSVISDIPRTYIFETNVIYYII